MTATSPVEVSDAGFRSLAPLLQAIAPETLNAARSRVAELDRSSLIKGFRKAYSSGKRVAAFVIADELTTRRIPPVFRYSHASATDCNLEQRFDLLVYDLRWLRRWYPDHARGVRYQRCKTLLTGSDKLFHREAEYMFYGGRRPVWKIVASLSLSETQQIDCYLLRSAPIKKRETATQAMCGRVFSALEADLKAARRTSAFTDNDANTTLLRRQQLWLCSRMVSSRSPTEIAERYMQMTGQRITRQAVGKQVAKIDGVLSKSEMRI
jgi:hypothetical protein